RRAAQKTSERGAARAAHAQHRRRKLHEPFQRGARRRAGGSAVRVGVSLTSAHTVDDPRQGARWMIERAAAAPKADLDSLFVGDHQGPAGTSDQNVRMLGRLLAEWSDKPAGCLFLLPLWNPVLIAEQVGTLAAIMRGRFIFQCGLGEDDVQFRAMGTSIKSRVTAFEESLSALRRLWAGEAV